jgi:hypothetical protein
MAIVPCFLHLAADIRPGVGCHRATTILDTRKTIILLGGTGAEVETVYRLRQVRRARRRNPTGKAAVQNPERK